MRDDEALQLLNRIVERLLDGWEPVVETIGDPFWMKATERPSNSRSVPMSPAEAAIIRQHQERGQ